MPGIQQNSSRKKISLQLRVFLQRYPLFGFIIKWLVLSVLIGGCAGIMSAGFLRSLDWVTSYREQHRWLIALLPIAGLLIGLLYHYKGKDIAAGNNLLLETFHKPKSIIPFRMAPFVYIGTIATHLFGGSAGREGTALQMAGAVADQFSKPFRLSAADRKLLIIAAIAAGFGSVFGTPIAGAVFGLEVVIIGRLAYEAVFPAFAAAIIADLVTKFLHAHHTQYHIGLVPAITFANIIWAVIAGIAFGTCAIVFSRSMHFTSALFKSSITYPPFRPLVGGILVAAAVWMIGTTKYIGLGIPVIVESFDTQLPAYDFAVKMAFTILTLAAGFKGGEVTPLFFIGAVLGNALSYCIPLPVGLLAGMGFVAVFAGATNTPLACGIMAMELFGSECGVYVAIACVTAYLVSGSNSIYNRPIAGSKNIIV